MTTSIKPGIRTRSETAVSRPQAAPTGTTGATPAADPQPQGAGPRILTERDVFGAPAAAPPAQAKATVQAPSASPSALWGKVWDALEKAAEAVVDVLDGPGKRPTPTPPAPTPPTPAPGPQPVGPSSRGGMGAIPYDGGTTFRVWAPNAQAVKVVGDFNGWDAATGTPLQSEGNGNWSFDVPGAEHGQKYKLLLQGKDGEWRWRNDPRAADVTNSVGDSVIYDHAKYQWQHDWDFRMPDWNEAVIYEMHVGTFNDAPGDGPGNWQSAIQRLDHLQDLGVNVIKMMPTAEFAGDFSWGYNPAFPFAPESAYGSPDDLKRFVDEAHKRGIAVVMDVVFNHLGPSDLPMWEFDGESLGNGGPYFYTDWRAKTPWGDTRPDFGRHEVREYVRDAALSWLRDYHMDGLRFDATWEIRNHGGTTNPEGWQVLRDINEVVNREFPQKLIIAEDMQNEAAVTDPRGANFDSQWDANFVHTLRRAVTAPNDESVDLDSVANAIRSSFNGQATQRIIYSESHDEVANGKQRLTSEVGGWDSEGYMAQKKSTLAAAVALTSPGIPMVFQGQELLEDGWFTDGDPLDWSKESEHAGIENLYGDLIKLRRNWFNNTQGLKGNNVNVFHVNNNDKVLAYHRWDKGGPGDDVIVITNFSGKSFEKYDLGLPSDGTWKVRFNSDWSGYSPDFGNAKVFDVGAHGGGKDGMPASGTITVPPYSTIILSKDR